MDFSRPRSKLAVMFHSAPRPPASPQAPPSDGVRRGSRPTAPSVRYLLYSHDGVGLGHVRRNLNIARALREIRPDAAVLLATSADELDAFPLPDGVDALRLPGLRKVDDSTYAARRLAVSPDEVRTLRAGVLAAAVDAYRPDVLVADKHPTGAQGELLTALHRLRSYGGRAVLGLRDVLDDPERTHHEWETGGLAGRVAEFYDHVLVYGQEELLDPFADCGLPEAIRERASYCGYVVAEQRPSAAARVRGHHAPHIVGMVGGGEDGAPLLSALLAAAQGAAWEATIVTGPKMAPSQRAALQASAGGTVTLVSSVPDLGNRLPDADAVVCMGGYNSLVEVLTAGVPAVCVPRTHPRTEQLIRARCLDDLGLLQMLDPATLDAAGVRTAVDTALEIDRAALAQRIRAVIDFGGAHRAAQVLAAFAPAHGTQRNGDHQPMPTNEVDVPTAPPPTTAPSIRHGEQGLAATPPATTAGLELVR